MDLMVSQAMAYYFYEQICGQHNGHMAAIPNNPVLYGLVAAHCAERKEDFTRFLRQVADELEKESPF